MAINLEKEIVLKLLNCILYNKKIDMKSIEAIDSVHYRHYSNIVQKMADMLKLEAMVRRFIKETTSLNNMSGSSRSALAEFYSQQLSRLRDAISRTNENAQETQSVIYFYFFLRPYYTEIIYLAKQVEIIKNADGGLIGTLLKLVTNSGSSLEVKLCEDAIRASEIPIYNKLTLWVNEGTFRSEGIENSFTKNANCDFFIKKSKDNSILLLDHLLPPSITYDIAKTALKCGKLVILLKENFTQQEISEITNTALVNLNIDSKSSEFRENILFRYNYINKIMMKLLNDVYSIDRILELTKNCMCFMDSSFSEALLDKIFLSNGLAKLESRKAHIVKRVFNVLQEKAEGELGKFKKNLLKVCHDTTSNKFVFYFTLRKTSIVRLIYSEEDIENLEKISKLLVTLNTFGFKMRRFNYEVILPFKKTMLNPGTKFIIQQYNKLNYIYTSLFETLGVYKVEVEFYKIKKSSKQSTDFFEMKEKINQSVRNMQENFTAEGQNQYWKILSELDIMLENLEELYPIVMKGDTAHRERRDILIDEVDLISSELDMIFKVFFKESKKMRHAHLDFLESYLNFNEYYTSKLSDNII